MPNQASRSAPAVRRCGLRAASLDFTSLSGVAVEKHLKGGAVVVSAERPLMGEVDGCAGSASGASLVELNVASVLESPQVGEEVASGEAEDVTEAGERQLVALGGGC